MVFIVNFFLRLYVLIFYLDIFVYGNLKYIKFWCSYVFLAFLLLFFLRLYVLIVLFRYFCSRQIKVYKILMFLRIFCVFIVKKKLRLYVLIFFFYFDVFVHGNLKYIKFWCSICEIWNIRLNRYSHIICAETLLFNQ